MRIFVEDIELDVDTRFQIKYQVTDGLSSAGGYSTEITLPPTSNNFRAFGLNDMITTVDTIFNFKTARADEDGVDLGIEKAELISTDPLVIRIYGTNSNFITNLKGKLSDLDWTNLDHVWDETNIPAGKNNTTGYTYPIINYGTLDTVTNDIQLSECFPAIYVKTAINKITEGYTQEIEFDDSYKYDKLIIPYSNEAPISLTEEERNTCGFEAYSSGQSVTLSTETEMTFANEVSDIGSNFVTRYTAPFDMFASFRLEVSARSAVALTTTDITFAIYKDDGSPTLLNQGTYNFTASYTSRIIPEFQYFFELHAGDEVYVTATPLTQNCQFQGGVDANGDGYTVFSLLEVSSAMTLGFTWRVGLNLPDLTQAQLVEYLLQSFASIIQVDERSKTVYMTRINTINKSQGEDWTDKIDLSKPIKRTFDMPDVGQKTTLKYLDDENVTKPTGTDYYFSVTSDKLEAEKNLYTAPFAACYNENKFSMGLSVVNVEINGESPCKPRILINKIKRIPQAINYKLNAVTITTDSSVHIPYFYDVSKSYDLTWTKLSSNLTTRISMIQNPRGLECYIRLNPADINQLNFRTKKWIGTLGDEVVNAWFFVSEVNYDTHDSSFVKLKLL